MAKIKIIKGDIFNMKKPVDMLVFRSVNTNDTTFVNSKYPNARYDMILPGYELNDENAMEFLDCYKKPVKRARELKMRTIAIEAVDMKDEDLTFAFAAELENVLKEASTLYDVSVFIVCKDRNICDIYEMAIFGETQSSQATMTDVLESNEVIIIPTTKKPMKWNKNYKSIKKNEASWIFWQYYFGKELEPGKFCLINGREYATFYYLINFDDKSRAHPDVYKNRVINALKATLNSIEFMACHNVTIPLLHFVKNKNKNQALIEMMLDEVCDFIEDREINVKFYCPEPDIWDFVQNWFEANELQSDKELIKHESE